MGWVLTLFRTADFSQILNIFRVALLEKFWQKNPMSGIYMIRCTTNGRYYIGGTTLSFECRFARHKSQLRRGKAPRLLQACHDLFGIESLEFVVLHQCAPEEVLSKEQQALRELKPDLNVYHVRAREGATSEPSSAMIGGEDLSISDIAARAGVCEKAIVARIKRGMSGDALLAEKHKAPRKPYVRRR